MFTKREYSKIKKECLFVTEFQASMIYEYLIGSVLKQSRSCDLTNSDRFVSQRS